MSWCLVLWSEINSAFSSHLTLYIAFWLTRFKRRGNFRKHHDVMIMIKHLAFTRTTKDLHVHRKSSTEKYNKGEFFHVDVTACETAQMRNEVLSKNERVILVCNEMAKFSFAIPINCSCVQVASNVFPKDFEKFECFVYSLIAQRLDYIFNLKAVNYFRQLILANKYWKANFELKALMRIK